MNVRACRFLLVLPWLFALVGVAYTQTVTSFVPAYGQVGEQVFVFGSGFLNAQSQSTVTNVQINNRNCPFEVVADTQLITTVAPGATTGRIRVQTRTGSALSTSNFVVIGPGPYIQDFTPSVGAAGTPVTINGVNLDGGTSTSVRFNGVLATTRDVVGPSQINATAPPSVSSGPISITTPQGTGVSTNFFYVPPVLTNVSSFTGRVGSNVVISGRNLAHVSLVEWNDTSGTFVTNSLNQVTATVPPDASTGRIRVTVPAGSAESSAYYVIFPTLASIAPMAGPVGSSVTIRGFNLNEGSVAKPVQIKFGSVLATISSISQTQAVVVVPASAVTAPISITTTNGTTTNATPFTVTVDSDVRVTATDSPDPVSVNADLTYVIGVTNLGPSIARSIKITNYFSRPITLKSATLTGSGSIVQNENRIEGSLNDIGSGTGVRVTLIVTPLQVGWLTNSIVALSTNLDANPANNLVQLQTTVTGPAALSITRSQADVILRWPVLHTNFVLQSTPNLNVPIAWTNVTGGSSIFGDERFATNPITGTQRFYRLRR